jgi:hypothetical protein
VFEYDFQIEALEETLFGFGREKLARTVYG